VVVGLGIDVASVPRIARALARHGQRFAERILTPVERDELAVKGALPPQAVAGRFAAKEAAAKALGGPADVYWQDIEVSRGERGAPVLRLLGAAREHATRLRVKRNLISITHDAGVAAAVVVLESE
jgi:holo-[acyl-carrier protein] synthase